jgi:hypothetical protein
LEDDDAVETGQAPTFPILRSVGIADATQLRIVPHDGCLTLYNDVEAFRERVAAGGDRDPGVGLQVLCLALVFTGCEVERAVEPDGDQALRAAAPEARLRTATTPPPSAAVARLASTPTPRRRGY